jgi:hypothetical protein
MNGGGIWRSASTMKWLLDLIDAYAALEQAAAELHYDFEDEGHAGRLMDNLGRARERVRAARETQHD